MSTYSPELRIELITNGDQVGYWGDTTNNNLGTLIEQAIAGYKSITLVSANQALNALDGISDEARNQCIKLVAATTGPFTVFIPPASKTYIAYNNTGYTVTFRVSTVINGTTSAGGVALSIPNNAIINFWTDGLDIFPANTYMPVLSVGALVLGTPLDAIYGGTGLSSYTTGDILVASSGTTVARLPDVATGNVLLSGGVATAPGYGKVGLTTHVSGVLPIANGGTGEATASAAINALLPTQTSNNGKFLTTDGTNTSWGTVTGTVSSVDVSGGTTGLTTSGGPITTSGTITLAGTLAATNGGTGQTSYAVGDLLFANTTTTISKLSDVATGNVLISGGVGVAPSYGKVGLTTHVSGTLPLANGGTNGTDAATARASLGTVSDPGANGILARTAANTTAARTITAGTGISVSNGNGVSGNPTITNTGVTSVNGSTGAVTVSSPVQVWVNFDGTTAGTNPASMNIRGSLNVASVTRTTTGTFTVNFSNALVDSNYAALITISGVGGSAVGWFTLTSLTSSSVSFNVKTDSGSLANPVTVCVAVMR